MMRCLAKLILIVLLLFGSTAALRKSRAASIDFTQHPVLANIRVVLSGFDGDGSLGWRIDKTVLSKTLSQLCPQVIPHARHPHPKPLRVAFNLTYQVSKVSSRSLDDALTLALLKASKGGASSQSMIVLDIDDQLKRVFAGVASAADGNKEDFTVIVTNPRPKPSVGMTLNQTYAYRYDNGAITQHWLGHERFVVLDYTAGPVQYGNAEDSESVFSSFNMRVIEKYYLDARIAAHVVSAVRQVFVPDIIDTALSHADRILIPLVVFRNHHEWNSFEDAHIDVALIKREIGALKRPSQELSFVTGVHHLHEHPHIALELAKSIRHDSVHEMDLKGNFGITQRPYVDSARLIAGLSGAADPLAEELLLPAGDKAAHAAFFSPSANALANSSVKAEGTHILPVYVFSLVSYADNLLLDKEGLVAATVNAVVVLQTDETAHPLPYFQMHDTSFLDATKSTRHILAGLATALGGLVPPDGSYSSAHKHILSDLTFANGHHPFGPFSNCSSLSSLHHDLYLRNLVISNIESAADSLTNAIVQINKFADAFIGSVDVEDMSETDNWIEFLYHRGEDSALPVAYTTVTRLHAELDKIYAKLADIVSLLSQHKYQEAYLRSVGFGRQASIFDSYIDSEIEQAEMRLLCCQITYEANRSDDEEEAGVSSSQVLPWVLFFSLVGSLGGVYIIRRGKPQRNRLVL